MNFQTLFEQINKHFFLRLLKAVYEDPKLGQQTRLVVEKPDAVACILYDTVYNNFIMVSQIRPAAYRREGLLTTLECPAGVNPDNEEALRKMYVEIAEETGHRLTYIEKICEVYPSVGTCTEKITLYAGLVQANLSVLETGIPEEGERIVVVRIPRQEIEDKIISGEISDMKFILGYYYMKAEDMF